MKNKIICLCGILIVTCTILFIFKNSEKNFYLDKKYYGTSGITEINFNELNDLRKKKESFAVFVYQNMCITSANLENLLDEFVKDNNLNIYKIAFSNIIDTDVGKDIKYYPSFIIYHNGEIVDFLQANKDEDISLYSSKDAFKKWFTTYIKLK